MGTWSFIGVMVGAGTLIAFQAPINAQLSQRTGMLESTLISFLTGTVLAVAAVLAFGKGSVRQLFGAPPWLWMGGLLGMGYVTAAIFCTPRIGVTNVMVAGLVGQLVTALVLDHLGLLGLQVQRIGVSRALGVPLLFLAMWLVRRPG